MSAGVIAASYVAETPSSDHIATLTVPSGTVPSTLTDFVTRVDLSEFPSAWFGEGDTDGSDVRVKQGGSVIPFDLVAYDGTTETGELFFKATLTTGDNVFTVEQVSGSSALDPTDTNGRNAVWADYEVAAIPGVATINRRDGGALTVTGTPALYGAIDAHYNLSGHDGMAFDGDYCYTTTNGAIYKYDTTTTPWTLVDSNTSAVSQIDAVFSGISGLSDPCIKGGELYVEAANEGSPSSGVVVAVFNLSDLEYNRYYDITSSGWAPASICWNPDDSHFYSVGFSYGTNVDTRIQKWDASWNLIGTLTTDSIPSKQGIEYWGGYFWISPNSGALRRVNTDGSGATIVANVSYSDGVSEGLAVDPDNNLWVMGERTGSTCDLYKLDVNSADHCHMNASSYLRAAGITKLTDWTMGASWYLPRRAVATRTLLSYSSNDSSDSNREAIFASAGSSRYILHNSSDGALSDTSIGAPAAGDRYRFNATHQGTTERKLWRQGVLRATDSGTANRPGGTGDALFIGTEDTSNGSPHFGSLTRVYLRNGILSADWLAAECESWESPSTFYAIT